MNKEEQAAKDYANRMTGEKVLIPHITPAEIEQAFICGVAWAEMEAIIEATTPIPAVSYLLEALEFYQKAFDTKLSGGGMGQFTPFLVDRGARATAAMSKYKEALSAANKVR